MLQKLFSTRDKIFLPLFSEMAKLIESAGYEILAMTETAENKLMEEHQKKIASLEKQGDAIVRKILHELYSVFLAPFDHEDIKDLTHALDDILDGIEAVSGQIILYQLNSNDPHMRSLAEIIQKSSVQIVELIENLKNLSKNRLLFDKFDELEEEGDRCCGQALHNLFQTQSDALVILKYKEIYERLEDIIDQCKDVCDLVEGFILKHT